MSEAEFTKLFNHMNKRFDEMKKRFDGTATKEQFDYLIKTLDRFLARLDNIEADDAARDAQLARYERWIMQLADKAGIELKI